MKSRYKIAEAARPRFRSAFKNALREAFDDAALAKVATALRDGHVEQAIAVVMDDASWAEFGAAVHRAYGEVLQRSAASAIAGLPKARVHKAKSPEPPPRFGEDWVKERSAELVADVTTQQRQALREIILDGYQREVQPKDIVDDIRDTVGLLPRELIAVDNRRQLHLDAGMNEDDADTLADDYAEELLEMRADRIAQTETVATEAQGRREAWSWAQEAGIISPQAVRVWVASDGACDECLAMDGETAPINGEYAGGEQIPMHPWCYCVEAIDENPEPEDDE